VALKKDRRGMAVLVDALIFLVALTLLTAMIFSSTDQRADEGPEMLGLYHSAMLSGQLPGEGGSAISSATLADLLIALSLSGAPDQDEVALIEEMVKGTIAELGQLYERAWAVIEIGPTELLFGSPPSEAAGDVHADRREMGDGRTASTLFYIN